MKHALLLIGLVVLVAGCTDDSSSTQGSSSLGPNYQDHNVNQENPMLTENYTLVKSVSDLPNTSSIYPAPGSTNFSTVGVISLYYTEDWQYMNYYMGLYERSSMNSVSFDTSSSSFDAKDYGFRVMAGLKPFTEYVLRLEDIHDGTVYYINYTTGEADTVKPFVDHVYTSGTQLEIFFNERINTSTITPGNVIVAGKTGKFDDIHVGGGYMEQDVYVDFNLSYYESYDVSIKGVKDLSGNEMLPQELSITGRTV